MDNPDAADRTRFATPSTALAPFTRHTSPPRSHSLGLCAIQGGHRPCPSSLLSRWRIFVRHGTP